MRSKFTMAGRYLTHRGTCPYTGEAFVRRYWLPVGTEDRPGGYVRIDTSADGRYPGTLGGQPHTNGSTWSCRTMAGLAALVRAEWRRECAQARK